MKRILVCLDGSPRAGAVLEAATRIAHAQGARLILLRSVGLPPDVPQDFWKTTDQPLSKLLETRAEQYLSEEAAKVPPELLEGLETHVGTPWQAICEVARDRKVDLVVIGSHGYSGVDRVIGTTAAKVVNHAPCSVLVVR
jgi:nucleotide-binding universal stress UspA family protein